MKTIKKLLSLTLATIIMVSMLPAHAEETEESHGTGFKGNLLLVPRLSEGGHDSTAGKFGRTDRFQAKMMEYRFPGGIADSTYHILNAKKLLDNLGYRDIEIVVGCYHGDRVTGFHTSAAQDRHIHGHTGDGETIKVVAQAGKILGISIHNRNIMPVVAEYLSKPDADFSTSNY